jgi:hypothetical protein
LAEAFSFVAEHRFYLRKERTDKSEKHGEVLKSFIWVWINTYENTIFRGMNIHLPAISGFTRYQGFDPSPFVLLIVLFHVIPTD